MFTPHINLLCTQLGLLDLLLSGLGFLRELPPSLGRRDDFFFLGYYLLIITRMLDFPLLDLRMGGATCT
jgi:hypothetical protein